MNDISSLNDLSLNGLIYMELKKAWLKKPPNVEKCNELLNTLKPVVAQIEDALRQRTKPKLSKEAMIMARGALEIAVELSLVNKDEMAFDDYMSQLKSFYNHKHYIGETDNMYRLLGLNLLYLLATNRNADFYIELEMMPADVVQSDMYIHPIFVLDQYIMDGRYNQFFLAKNDVFECDSYKHFMDMLSNHVRDEIGTCIEKCYERMSVQDAANRLYLETPEEMHALAQKFKWSVGPGGFYYFMDKDKPK